MILQRVMSCTNRGNNSKRGSVVLETAITFTITLIFICSMISVIVFMRTDILMQRSFDQACEQTAVLTPLSIPLSDTVSVLVNAFPEIGIGSSRGGEVLKKVASVIGGIDLYTGNSLENLLLEQTLAHDIANKVRGGYIERNNGSGFFVPDLIDIDIRINKKMCIMEVTCTYRVLTLAGNIERRIYSSVPVYGRLDLMLNPLGTKKEERDIWSEDNFTRGDFFREENGSNLPKTFPVIDSFDKGTCTSVYSIDLTSPYYASDRRVMNQLKGEIDSLADFDGADVMINKRRYVVDGSDIRNRVLTVVIPGNADDASRSRVSSMSGYASLRGVKMNIVEYGTSGRYQASEDT